jgi:hypothetical protein
MDGSLDEAIQAVRLSVVVDGRLDAARARQVATLTDRLGLAGVWLRYPWWPLSGTPASASGRAGLLAALASGVQASGVRVPPGLIVDADAADTGEADAGLPPRLRVAIAGSSPAISRWQGRLGRRPGVAVTQLALPVGDAGAPADAVFVPCSPGRNLAAEVSAAASAAGGRPVLAEVTVSVGRTAAEATARVDADEMFTLAGHPAQQGLFGTLEECQATAALLAHAGATELVCYLPLASDLPDVLAQLRSIAIGAAVLRPGEPPSAAPPPPAGWGGRRFPV